jgi:hypothetical protein
MKLQRPGRADTSTKPGDLYGKKSFKHIGAFVIKYVLGQEEHNKRGRFKWEFLSLVEEQEIEYDPRQMWY